MSAIRTKMPRVIRLVLLGVLAIVLFSTFAGPVGRAQTSSQPWTRVGSDGTIDEQDLDLYVVHGSTLRVRSVGDVLARYNVEPVAGLFETGDRTFLRVRFRDNGAGARVRVSLWRASVFANDQEVLLSFDSDNYAASGSLQLQEVGSCPGINFDFDNNVYWIEATLEMTDAEGRPRLALLQIGQTVC